MIKTTAVKLLRSEPMMVTWDLGRRCNYDCTYCESTRHNNYSRHRTFDELKNTLNFIKKYSSLYGHEQINISFTGGEPTTNPIFFKFAEYARDFNSFNLGLTTNGTFSHKLIDKIENIFSWIVVSYHAESNAKLKKKVLENIKLLSSKNIRLSVNVMMHVEYWDECIEVCETLKSLGIKFNPRPIGDGNVTRKGWFQDADGTQRRTSHEYSKEQQDWYFSFMNVPAPSAEKREGTELGRNCCGGRCMEGKVNNVWQSVNLIDTNFQNWYCSVNKYFLHIDNETELVYHHQTCQAKFGKTRGSIGSLSDTESIYRYIEENKNNTIVCPNLRCGCGMCVPKAKSKEDFDDIMGINR